MSITFQIEISRTDLDLELCVTSGQVFRWQKDSQGVWNGVDGLNWYRARQASNRLEIESNRPQENFRSLFRLDWGGTAIRERIADRGPEIGPLIEQLPGLRLMCPSSESETLFCFMCTANNHLSRITSMIRTLSEYGDLISESEPFRYFPTVSRISEIPESELREKGFGYRAKSITIAALQLLELGGEGYLKALRKLTYLEAKQSLTQIHGIGPKLADCICLFGLGFTEAVPVDTHIWQAVVRHYFPQWQGTALTDKKYTEIEAFMFERFGELAGWAHQYLFYENLLNWRTRK